MLRDDYYGVGCYGMVCVHNEVTSMYLMFAIQTNVEGILTGTPTTKARRTY